MESSALTEGRYYAYREKRTRGAPLVKVKLLSKLPQRRKVKIRYAEGPYPGLEEYVLMQRLIVPWGERRALLRDEERSTRIDEVSGGHLDAARAEAVATVLASSGEPSAWAEPSGLSMPEQEVDRIARRAGLAEDPARLHPLGFVDRHGEVHLPLDGAEVLARAFAAAEPQTVLMYIEDHEQELKVGGYAAGDRYKHDLLRQYMPGFAIARQWAGHEREIEGLQKELGRLQGLVSMAAADLSALGADGKARRLRRALEGR